MSKLSQETKEFELMPTKAELRAARLVRIAEGMRDLVLNEPDQTNVDTVEPYDPSSLLWNLGDLFDDKVAPEPYDDSTFRGPHKNIEKRRLKKHIVQDTRPPRGVKR